MEGAVMTNIYRLISPLPDPTPAPKFPTPWSAEDIGVFDANGGCVAKIQTRTNGALNTPEEREAIARFIADAVNEKIARDDHQAKIDQNVEDGLIRPARTIVDDLGRFVDDVRAEVFDYENGTHRDKLEAFDAIAEIVRRSYLR